MIKLKVINIDDEKLALQFMQHLLSEIEDITVVGTFQNPVEGFDFIINHDVDVVFLDIQMPRINGIELAEKIIEKKPDIDIVFVTAYNQYAVTAFELNAIDYLVKPVNLSRLKNTIARLRSQRLAVRSETEKEDIFHIYLEKNVSYAVNDEEIQIFKWRTAKARELFLYLLKNENKLVHKESIIEWLWSEIDLEKAYSLLYTTVYNVRKTLQPFQKHFELKNTNDGYILRCHNVEVDLHVWENKLSQLPEMSDAAIAQYEEVMSLNTSSFLEDYSYIWIEPERQRLENLWLDCAQKIVHYYKEKQDYSNLIQWYQKMIDRMPELEEVHLSLMKLYAKLGRFHLVKRQYEYYVIVQENYGLDPDPEIEKWFNNFIELN